MNWHQLKFSAPRCGEQRLLRGNAAELLLRFSVALDLQPGLVSVAGSCLDAEYEGYLNQTERAYGSWSEFCLLSLCHLVH